jgi:hypothetical protein
MIEQQPLFSSDGRQLFMRIKDHVPDGDTTGWLLIGTMELGAYAHMVAQYANEGDRLINADLHKVFEVPS